jgi:glycosyltransferase involved in cell wall biosynthesis
MTSMTGAVWLLVAGDFTPLGGMDRANHALASYLADRNAEVHLVTHRAWPDLEAKPAVSLHRVWRPFGRHLLGGPLLAGVGRRTWRRLQAKRARAVVNGGNCSVAAVNWVHFLHAAYEPAAGHGVARTGLAGTTKQSVARRMDLIAERQALGRASVVICNSRRTRTDVIENIGIPSDRVHVVYYGSDSARFSAATVADRTDARRMLGCRPDRPVVGFVGALGDRRKGFDVLFDAWRELCRDTRWDADLVVLGAGVEMPRWRARADAAGLTERMRFLGFRKDAAEIVAGFDVLVHPARYEAYGLSVHEAICRGVPALVSGSSGVAERYPGDLSDLLIENPESAGEVGERLRAWRAHLESWRDRLVPLSGALRARSWDAMAEDLTLLAEQAA